MDRAHSLKRKPKVSKLSQTQLNSLLGNTRSRSFFFTFNGYTEEELSKMRTWLEQKDKFVMQQEKGESGNLHLQGVVYHKSQMTFNSLKKMFPKVHWDRCKNLQKAVEYCSKIDTRDGQLWVKGFTLRRPVPDPLQGKELYPWQEELNNKLSAEPDDRTILWYIDEEGGSGKSAFQKHYILREGLDSNLPVSGGLKDIAYALTDKHRTIWVDVPRTKEKYLQYSALEKIKDGVVFSGKYESCAKLIAPVHVVVLSNFYPEWSSMSRDRWEVYLICKDTKTATLIEYPTGYVIPQ